MAAIIKDRPLKILGIHGYRQSAQTFREKTGSFRKLTKKHTEITYITAPHIVPPGNMGSAAWAAKPTTDHHMPDNDNDGTDTDTDASNGSGVSQSQNENVKNDSCEASNERGWWFSREDDYFKSSDHSDIAKGFEESLQLAVKTLENEEGGFDGILGFSQGATFVSILCLMQEQMKKNWFKFAILVAGFKSRLSPHDVYYNQAISSIPSLHVIGEGDKVISTDMSEELAKCFLNPVKLFHPGGHFVPASGPQKQPYLQFLQDMKQQCCCI